MKILANVNGNPITDEEVDAFLARLGQRGAAYNNPEGRKMILEQLVGAKLMLLDAQRNLYEAEPAFKAQLKAVKEELLANYATEKAIAGVSVSDDEAQKYYNDNPDKFQGQPTVSASHILVETAEKAEEVLAEIKSGAITFEDAAKKYSSCPSKEEGGSLGTFGRGQMVPEFENAAFEMEVGELRGPVMTQFGAHVIRLDGKDAGKPVAFTDVKDRIKQMLLQEKQSKAYESKINQLKILYPVDMTV